MVELINPLPFIVKVSGPAKARAEEGERLVMAGTGLAGCTAKAAAGELPPPGAGLAGFSTVICNVPALATSFAGIVVCKEVVLMNNV